MDNFIQLTLPAKSKNEALARSIVAAFSVELNPTIDELSDIKTAVSEAVTNSIVHGYNGDDSGKIYIYARLEGRLLHIEISDDGDGIKDIEKARMPFFTTKSSDDRSGMGFTVMESFMDTLEIKNRVEGGLKVTMRKLITRE